MTARRSYDDAMARPGRKVAAEVDVFDGERWRRVPDQLATEEPLEIRLDVAGQVRKLAVTMRTPGADFELAVGFLHGEGVIAGPGDVRRVAYCSTAVSSRSSATTWSPWRWPVCLPNWN